MDMESLTVASDTYINRQHSQNILLTDIIPSNRCSEDSPTFIQNFIINHLDDNNIELISCNNQEKTVLQVIKKDIQVSNKSTVPSQNISDIHLATKSTSKKIISNNMVFDQGLKSRRKNSFGKSIEVPVVRNSQPNSVIQHSSATCLRAASSNKQLKQEIPIVSRPERKMVDKTTYSCFKCSEKFNRLTLFRQHLKWHQAKKMFNCSICMSGFNAENNLKIHMVTSHPGTSDMCPICEVRFQRKASLKSHVMTHQVDEIFLCEVCHGEFQNDDELLKHMESHAVSKVTKALSESLVCPYCKLEFRTLTDYRLHIGRHVEVKRSVLKGKKVRKKKVKEKETGGFKCKYCGKVFPKSCLLDRHERIHTGEKPYRCHSCNKAFAQKGTLLIHLDKHTGIKPHPCTLCSAKFSQKGNLRAHVQKTHTAPKGKQIYKCLQCTCIFRKIATLNGHMTKVHLSQQEELSDSQNLIEKVMDSLRELNSELGKSALKQDEPKPASSLPVNSGTSLVKLAESHASGGIRRYTVRHKKIGDVRWYFCSCCSSRFKKPSDLIRHFRTHTLEKPFKCSKCNQAFSLKSTLTNHLKIHDKPECECDYCDSCFRNSRNFNAHVRKHVKDSISNYICLLCEKVFNTLDEGKEHRSTHEGEIQSTQNIIEPIVKQPLYQTTYGSLPLKPPKSKVPNTGTESLLERPHHCIICDAKFTRLMSLKRHMLHHSGEKKFICNLCPKSFITKYRLKEHLNYHKNIKNFGCQTCGKKFVTSSLLKRHTIVHNRVRPYMCPYCETHFKTVLLCRSHIRNIHQLEAAEAQREKSSVVGKNITHSTSDKADRSDVVIGGSLTCQDIPVSKEKLLMSIEPEQPPQERTPAVKMQQNDSVTLNISPQNPETRDLQPSFQMVYLNISDLPVTNSDEILNRDNLMASLKLHNDSYLFNPLNDLQDSGVLFNMDTGKADSVDPNEVIKSRTVICNPSEISASLEKTTVQTTSQQHNSEQVHSNMESLKTVQTPVVTTGHQEISVQGFSTMDLGGLPISIIDASDSTTLSTSLVNGEVIPYDAQVICINCHKMFSDYYVFEKHLCSEDTSAQPQDSVKLLIQGGAVSDIRPNDLYGKLYNPSDMDTSTSDADGKVANSIVGSDFYESGDLAINSMPNAKLDLEKIKRFTYKKSLLMDVDKLEQAKQFSCKHCHFSTSIEDRFRKHLFFHPDISDKICKFCLKEFKKPSDLKRHHRTHTGEKPFDCELCHKKFSLKSTLESHLRTHVMAGVTRITCDVCNSNFTSKSSLKVHMLLHTGARPHTCTFCEHTFRTSANRKAHEKSVHLSKNQESFTDKIKLEGAKLLKSVAEEVVENVRKETRSNQQKVIKTLLPKEPPAAAAVVNSGQPDPISLDSVFFLQQLQNSGIIIAPGADGSMPINLADIAVLDISDLQMDDIGRGVCISENSDSSKLLQQERNITLQEQKQRVECDICHKLYASKDVLRKHKKTLHGQNKKFPCIKCDKGYDQLEELNKHIAKLHTGCRPYACQYCANSFSEENSLKTHIKRIHQKSLVGQEMTNALLGLQYDLSSKDNFV